MPDIKKIEQEAANSNQVKTANTAAGLSKEEQEILQRLDANANTPFINKNYKNPGDRSTEYGQLLQKQRDFEHAKETGKHYLDDIFIEELHKTLIQDVSFWTNFNNVRKRFLPELAIGAVNTIGAIRETPSYLTNSSDFTNSSLKFAADWRAELDETMPILKKNPYKTFDMRDPNWWLEGFNQTATSILGIMIPAAGITKGLSLLTKGFVNTANVTKLNAIYNTLGAGSKAGKFIEAFSMATTMRLTENFMEAYETKQTFLEDNKNLFFDKDNPNYISDENFEKIKKENNIDPNATREDTFDLIAALTAKRAFNVNNVNFVFDFIQMGHLLGAFRGISKAVPKSKLPGVFNVNRLPMGAAKARAKEMGLKFNSWSYGTGSLLNNFIWQGIPEGFEEMINHIGNEEGLHYGKYLLGQTPKGKFGKRLGEYTSDLRFYEAAWWGAIGGTLMPYAFNAGGKVKNKIQEKVTNKYGENTPKWIQKEQVQLDAEGAPLLFDSEKAVSTVFVPTEPEETELFKRNLEVKAFEKRKAMLERGINPYNENEITDETEKKAIKRKLINDFAIQITRNAHNTNSKNYLLNLFENPEYLKTLEAEGLTEEDKKLLKQDVDKAFEVIETSEKQFDNYILKHTPVGNIIRNRYVATALNQFTNELIYDEYSENLKTKEENEGINKNFNEQEKALLANYKQEFLLRAKIEYLKELLETNKENMVDAGITSLQESITKAEEELTAIKKDENRIGNKIEKIKRETESVENKITNINKKIANINAENLQKTSEKSLYTLKAKTLTKLKEDKKSLEKEIKKEKDGVKKRALNTKLTTLNEKINNTQTWLDNYAKKNQEAIDKNKEFKLERANLEAEIRALNNESKKFEEQFEKDKQLYEFYFENAFEKNKAITTEELDEISKKDTKTNDLLKLAVFDAHIEKDKAYQKDLWQHSKEHYDREVDNITADANNFINNLKEEVKEKIEKNKASILASENVKEEIEKLIEEIIPDGFKKKKYKKNFESFVNKAISELELEKKKLELTKSTTEETAVDLDSKQSETPASEAAEVLPIGNTQDNLTNINSEEVDENDPTLTGETGLISSIETAQSTNTKSEIEAKKAEIEAEIEKLKKDKKEEISNADKEGLRFNKDDGKGEYVITAKGNLYINEINVKYDAQIAQKQEELKTLEETNTIETVNIETEDFNDIDVSIETKIELDQTDISDETNILDISSQLESIASNLGIENASLLESLKNLKDEINFAEVITDENEDNYDYLNALHHLERIKEIEKTASNKELYAPVIKTIQDILTKFQEKRAFNLNEVNPNQLNIWLNVKNYDLSNVDKHGNIEINKSTKAVNFNFSNLLYYLSEKAQAGDKVKISIARERGDFLSDEEFREYAEKADLNVANAPLVIKLANNTIVGYLNTLDYLNEESDLMDFLNGLSDAKLIGLVNVFKAYKDGKLSSSIESDPIVKKAISIFSTVSQEKVISHLENLLLFGHISITENVTGKEIKESLKIWTNKIQTDLKNNAKVRQKVTENNGETIELSIGKVTTGGVLTARDKTGQTISNSLKDVLVNSNDKHNLTVNSEGQLYIGITVPKKNTRVRVPVFSSYVNQLESTEKQAFVSLFKSTLLDMFNQIKVNNWKLGDKDYKTALNKINLLIKSDARNREDIVGGKRAGFNIFNNGDFFYTIQIWDKQKQQTRDFKIFLENGELKIKDFNSTAKYADISIDQLIENAQFNVDFKTLHLNPKIVDPFDNTEKTYKEYLFDRNAIKIGIAKYKGNGFETHFGIKSNKKNSYNMGVFLDVSSMENKRKVINIDSLNSSISTPLAKASDVLNLVQGSEYGFFKELFDKNIITFEETIQETDKYIMAMTKNTNVFTVSQRANTVNDRLKTRIFAHESIHGLLNYLFSSNPALRVKYETEIKNYLVELNKHLKDNNLTVENVLKDSPNLHESVNKILEIIEGNLDEVATYAFADYGFAVFLERLDANHGKYENVKKDTYKSKTFWGKLKNIIKSIIEKGIKQFNPNFSQLDKLNAILDGVFYDSFKKSDLSFLNGKTATSANENTNTVNKEQESKDIEDDFEDIFSAEVATDENTPNVNFQLKIVSSLLNLKDNRQTIRLNTKEKPYLEENLRKTLAGKGVTTNQIDFVFQYMKSNNIQEISTEDLALELAANYSYTIEINTAKEDIENVNFTESDGKYYYNDNTGDEIEITKDFYEKELEKLKNKVNTQHYSNLAVPGGTNYTENAHIIPELEGVVLPDIYPHHDKEFADGKLNMFGWDRSDDKFVPNNIHTHNPLYTYYNFIKDSSVFPTRYIGGQKIFEYNNQFIVTDRNTNKILGEYATKKEAEDYISNLPKTRRIQEIQSKFQKWRLNFEHKNNKYQLLENQPTNEPNKVEDHYLENGKRITSKEYNKIFEDFLDTPTSKEDGFIKLIAKQWETIMIKSIIQNAAKKGYEKVLFPSGNTASKVEGHTTLEEFKKQKENRIKELEKQKEQVFNKATVKNENRTKIVTGNTEYGEYGYIKENDKWFSFYDNNVIKNKEYLLEDILKEENSILTSENVNKKGLIDNIDNEITQLKQELERVETEGFGALKPIYNFYENTVTNILKKQGYNPVVITDEYGNTWNEVTIDKNRDLDTISFAEVATDENDFGNTSLQSFNEPNPTKNITEEVKDLGNKNIFYQDEIKEYNLVKSYIESLRGLKYRNQDNNYLKAVQELKAVFGNKVETTYFGEDIKLLQVNLPKLKQTYSLNYAKQEARKELESLQVIDKFNRFEKGFNAFSFFTQFNLDYQKKYGIFEAPILTFDLNNDGSGTVYFNKNVPFGKFDKTNTKQLLICI